ncbi:DinB family protein [bacterium]|nr:DinB family protein [bacterium]
MSALWTHRPAADEHPAYYARYVERVEVGKPPAVFGRQLAQTLSLLESISEAQALTRYAPGKWSIKEVLGHIADSERILAMRALCIARGERAELPGFDENAYVAAAGFDARPWSALREELRRVREATIALFDGFTAEQLQRRGRANQGEFSVRALGWIIAGHEAHHLAVLRARYLG